MTKRPGEEDREYSVDEIIAEFKDTQLRTPEERQADAPLFSEPEQQEPPPEREPAADKEEKPRPEKMALGESRIIDITSRLPVQQGEPEKRKRKEKAREQPHPPADKEERKAGREEKAAPKAAPAGKGPEEERGKVRKFPQPPRPAPAPPPEELYEDDYEEEEEKEPVPYDFLFEGDPDNIPHTIQNLGKKIKRLRIRSILLFLLLAVGVAATVLPQLPVTLPAVIRYERVPQIYTLVMCGALALSLLAAGDVLLAGIYRLCRLRPTLDTVVLLAAFSALAHGMWCLGQPPGTLPYTAVAQMTLFYAVIAKRGRLLMLRRTYKAAILSTAPVCVCTKENKQQRTMAYKSQTAAEPDLASIDAPDSTMRFGCIYAPLAIVAAVALAAVASFGQGRPERFLECLAVISTMLAPAGLLLATATPGMRISKKLFTSGTALLNQAAAKELDWAELAVLTDGDVFPQGTVAISGMKIARNQSMERVVASAAGALSEVGGGLGYAFADFAKQQYIFVPTPSRVEYYDNGGISAKIGQNSVLCGTASFLMRMGIHVSEGRTIKSGVFVAINSAFAGVFALKYTAQPQSYSAFRVLRVGHIRPVLAVKDFNVTPLMVEDKFDLRPGRTDFPDMEERVRLNRGDGKGRAQPLALLSRGTMLSFCECVTAAHRLCRAQRFNTICSVTAAVVGVLLMYFLSSTGNLAAGGPVNVFFYLLLWFIPVLLQSLLSSRY